MTTSAHVRARLVDVLRKDLIGPGRDDEVLQQSPSRWYLTGFLVPTATPEHADDDGQDQIELLEKPSGGDDEAAPERPSAKKVYFPSSMGISVLVDKGTKVLDVDVTWGDYEKAGGSDDDKGAADLDESHVDGAGKKKRVKWERSARRESVSLTLADKQDAHPVPNSGGLELVLSIEAVGEDSALALPAGTRSVSIFLVNRRDPKPSAVREEAYAFQVALCVKSSSPFVARPNLRGRDTGDNDERVADLQYRDVFELAVGHGTGTHAVLVKGERSEECREVHTTPMPTGEVAKVAPARIDGVETSMETIGAAKTFAELKAQLSPLVEQYAKWLADQKKAADADASIHGRRVDVAADLLKRAELARKRIARGIALLDDAQVRDAFCTANRVMAKQARQRAPERYRKPEETPRWRVFQLGFLLMNLAGIAEPTDKDRSLVDLIFFPTGGGKTEAYLGLAAFTLVLRRLKNPGVESAGVSVLMRYTLRLLTLDQLSRACTLICALELERQNDVGRLGTWPFEIGLWVGKAATPNKMGKKGDDDDSTARAVTKTFQRDDRKRMPIPLENCPWCNARFTKDSFRLHPDENKPLELHIQCVSRDCLWNRGQHLPIVAVDDAIYRRLPCFLIATVDKFAALPWEGRSGTLFGKVDRHDKAGFYGPCDPGVGSKLPTSSLPPPDLVIQDELHLISGPLGTMVGLYETAIDALSARKLGDVEVRPKIVASTATVRRAQSQIQALFGRNDVAIFPPPGPSLEDSFFAGMQTIEQQPGRLYVGLAAQGQSLKVVLLRTYIALLSAALAEYASAGGAAAGEKNPADPYMTLLGYFSSLRELGGSRRIIEDEVRARLAGYSKRDERAGAFADRKIQEDVIELTSRVPTNKVADAKRRLGLPASHKETVDVAIATNMISVGLDITRLGLMVVLGQPVTTAEYIQASSRVGRDDDKPGIVVTLFNIYRPRDRSHYERFEAYHASFYRAVEATSVTPFSPRALDRGLPGVTVALARQGIAALTPPGGAGHVAEQVKELAKVADILARRAEAHGGLPDNELEATAKTVRDRTNSLLDSWKHVAAEKDTGLQYQREEPGAAPLLFMPLDPQLAEQSKHGRRFKANRSLRDVELSVNLWVRRLDTGATVEADDGDES